MQRALDNFIGEVHIGNSVGSFPELFLAAHDGIVDIVKPDQKLFQYITCSLHLRHLIAPL